MSTSYFYSDTINSIFDKFLFFKKDHCQLLFYFFESFSHQRKQMVFLWSLSDSKSPGHFSVFWRILIMGCLDSFSVLVIRPSALGKAQNHITICFGEDWLNVPAIRPSWGIGSQWDSKPHLYLPWGRLVKRTSNSTILRNKLSVRFKITSLSA